MVDFTIFAKVFTTLLLIGLVVFVWNQNKDVSNEKKSTFSNKKRSKKKKMKKKISDGMDVIESVSTHVQSQLKPTKETSGNTNTVSKGNTSTNKLQDTKPLLNKSISSTSGYSSDEDEGLSAMQVLSQRTFKPTSIGRSNKVGESIQSKFYKGQAVEARFAKGQEWFPATIQEVKSQYHYHLAYDDGEVEYNVSHALIRPRRENNAEESEVVHTESVIHETDEINSTSDAKYSEDEDGWHVVEKSQKTKIKGAIPKSVETENPGDELTKRQRENRRKRERQKEVKELLRAQAQEEGLHARWGGTKNKYKYMPPPTS